jgi:hypothetical protein
MRTFFLLILAMTLFVSVSAGADSISFGSFTKSGLEGWKTRSFKGETDYRIVEDEGQKVLQANSRDSASGLIFETDYDPSQFPVLTWRWKVDHVIARGDSRNKSTDDYAARIYVVFPHWFFPMTRTINYIWANRLPKGSSQLSTFTSNDMMIAVESGSARVGQWVTVRRNVVEDYRRAFGVDPPNVGAIAIMTDTDQTGESAIAWYGDIVALRQ